MVLSVCLLVWLRSHCILVLKKSQEVMVFLATVIPVGICRKNRNVIVIVVVNEA